MRKWLTCLLLLILCMPLLLAQRVPARLLPWKKEPVQHLQSTSKLTEINISRQLQKRLSQTYQQAKIAQKSLPTNRYIIMGEPVAKIFKTQELDPKELYPEQTFLKTSAQTGNYLATRNNRLFLQEVRRMEKIWAQIDENLPRLQQEAANTPQPQDPIAWLAETIPVQTTQLFLGEVHLKTPEIHQAVTRVLQEIRARDAQREIILFTEFLPENFTWRGKKHPKARGIEYPFTNFFDIWDAALQAQIQVIGLEHPAAVEDNCVVRYLNTNGVHSKQSVWSSLEGVRLRNERWKKTLATYRAKHPNALFIIYTGADHVLYNRPFTISTPTGNEKNFVVGLYPDRYLSIVGHFTGVLVSREQPGPLERLVRHLKFKRQTVKWKSTDLPDIAGFDVRIKIPITLAEIDY